LIAATLAMDRHFILFVAKILGLLLGLKRRGGGRRERVAAEYDVQGLFRKRKRGAPGPPP